MRILCPSTHRTAAATRTRCGLLRCHSTVSAVRAATHHSASCIVLRSRTSGTLVTGPRTFAGPRSSTCTSVSRPGLSTTPTLTISGRSGCRRCGSASRLSRPAFGRTQHARARIWILQPGGTQVSRQHLNNIAQRSHHSRKEVLQTYGGQQPGVIYEVVSRTVWMKGNALNSTGI
jgi:hypothetical protein